MELLANTAVKLGLIHSISKSDSEILNWSHSVEMYRDSTDERLSMLAYYILMIKRPNMCNKILKCTQHGKNK